MAATGGANVSSEEQVMKPNLAILEAVVKRNKTNKKEGNASRPQIQTLDVRADSGHVRA
jgi:hypothetical protein